MTSLPTRRSVAAALAGGFAGAAALPLIARGADGKTHIVRITDFAFVPEVVEAQVGDVIRWVNEDLAPHTATANDEAWDTDGLETGDAAEIDVTADMTRDYYCVYHPMMKGRIVIPEQ